MTHYKSFFCDAYTLKNFSSFFFLLFFLSVFIITMKSLLGQFCSVGWLLGWFADYWQLKDRPTNCDWTPVRGWRLYSCRSLEVAAVSDYFWKKNWLYVLNLLGHSCWNTAWNLNTSDRDFMYFITHFVVYHCEFFPLHNEFQDFPVLFYFLFIYFFLVICEFLFFYAFFFVLLCIYLLSHIIILWGYDDDDFGNFAFFSINFHF